MAWRDMIREHPGATAAIAVAIIAIAAWRMANQGPSQPQLTQWFFDLQSHDLFRYEGDEPSPIQTATGSEAVKAYVFAKDCTAPRLQNIAYIEKWSETGKAYLRNPGAGGSVSGAAGNKEPVRFVAVPNAEGALQWFDVATDAGRRIQAREKQIRDQGMINCDLH